MSEMGKHPPKHCPQCGGITIGAVPAWRYSQWLADPSNPDWEPFHGTSYDTYCYDCEKCFDISPQDEADLYWYDEHPEDLPEGGNKIYTDILLKRSYNEDAERCGNCVNFYNNFVPIAGSSYSKLEIYCELDKEKKVSYYKPCIFNPSRFLVGGERSK